MPNLLAMSFEGELAPSFTLHCLESGRTLPDGWGLGYYPAGEPTAAILKEPAPPQGSMRSQLDAKIQLLTRTKQKLDQCIGCGCLSLSRCQLYNRDDRAAVGGSGPRFVLA